MWIPLSCISWIEEEDLGINSDSPESAHILIAVQALITLILKFLGNGTLLLSYQGNGVPVRRPLVPSANGVTVYHTMRVQKQLHLSLQGDKALVSWPPRSHFQELFSYQGADCLVSEGWLPSCSHLDQFLRTMNAAAGGKQGRSEHKRDESEMGTARVGIR